MHIYKDVEPLEEDCVDAEEVRRHQGLGMGSQELFPGQPRSATSRWDAGGEEHRSDRGRRHAVAELQKLSANPEVAPAGILARHAQDQLATAFRCRRPPAPW